MSTWRLVRIVIIALSFMEGLLYPFFATEAPLEGAPIAIQVFLIVLPLFFFPFSLTMGLFIQSKNPFQNTQWTLPDWDSNFLNMKNPLHFFHAAAYFIAASSFGLIIASFFSSTSYLPIGLAGVSSWGGVLIGIKLCITKYHDKFQPVPDTLRQMKSLGVIKTSKIIGAILILCTLITTSIAAVLLAKYTRFKNNAIETEAIITHYETRNSDAQTIYYPVFAFTDHIGQIHTVCSATGSNPPRNNIQDKILILYNPKNPAEARISSSGSLYAIPTVLGISGVINLVAGLIFLFVIPARQKM
ncbi:MAG: DUF3592 domain-containing protein [Sedimentisphaerales bacterium]|nr:DUF3592 domain-containing protein [Sedimentisphaerales bacterium]